MTKEEFRIYTYVFYIYSIYIYSSRLRIGWENCEWDEEERVTFDGE